MLTLNDMILRDKRVLLRVDFNVPLANGRVADDARIQAHIPTISNLLEAGAKVILCSHMGRPKGRPDAHYSLEPVAAYLSLMLHMPVRFVPDCVGPVAEQAVAEMRAGEIILLENLRFHPGETENDPAFAQQLAALADIYVNDAFGTAHRAHASTSAITQYVEKVAIGRLMQHELEALAHVLDTPKRPVLMVIGGAKISSKISMIKHLLPKADQIMIGGAMANTFLAAQGHGMGTSLYESEYLQEALGILSDAATMGCRVLLPTDLIVAREFTRNAPCKTVSVDHVPADMMALDIGPRTSDMWCRMIGEAGTILWNGPVGAFETLPFNEGTRMIAHAIGQAKAYSVAGGGDTLAAIKQSNTRGIDYISTGGGSLLEYLEGRQLPALKALEQHKKSA